MSRQPVSERCSSPIAAEVPLRGSEDHAPCGRTTLKAGLGFTDGCRWQNLSRTAAKTPSSLQGEKQVLGELTLGSPVSATATPANGVLFVATMTHLYAIKSGSMAK
jgi:hypothetical protein